MFTHTAIASSSDVPVSTVCLTTAGAMAEGFSTNIILQPCQIGSFTAPAAGVTVKDFNEGKELLVQFVVCVGKIGDSEDFSKKLHEIPIDRVSAWILTDESRTLRLIGKSPLPEQCPGGSSSTGSVGYGFINFRFDLSSGGKPEAVVVRMGNKLHVFPLIGDKPD